MNGWPMFGNGVETLRDMFRRRRMAVRQVNLRI